MGDDRRFAERYFLVSRLQLFSHAPRQWRLVIWCPRKRQREAVDAGLLARGQRGNRTRIEPAREKQSYRHVGNQMRAHRVFQSEEHASELQSRLHLVCRLLLEKKKKTKRNRHYRTS